MAAQIALLCTPALSLLLSDLALVLGVWARSWGLLLNLLLLLLRLLLLLPFRYGRNSPAVAGVHPRSSLSDLHPCVCYQQKLGVALATVSPSSSSSSGHELPRNPPGLILCRNVSATFLWAAFTCTEMLDNRQDNSLQ